MLNALRHWHWMLLHRVFGLPDLHRTEPHAPLSVVLRSHPAVAAHRRQVGKGSHLSLHAQRERERRREPRILKGWQRRIAALFGHRGSRPSIDALAH